MTQKNNLIDRIKSEISIINLAQKEGFTVLKTGSFYTLKEHNSVILFPKTNSYYQFSKQTGGSNIDFLINLRNMSKSQAINRLREDIEMENNQPKTLNLQINKKVKNFILPKPAENNNRVNAYLSIKRAIDSRVVKTLFSNKDKGKSYIYQDVNYNAVFVGCDENGQAVSASKRSSLPHSNYKGDVAGSNQEIGWAIDNKSDKVFVCESVIDVMSSMCINHDFYADKFSYISLDGVSKTKKLFNFLHKNPQVKTVVLELDDDEAGRATDKKIAKIMEEKHPKIKLEIKKPMNGKDLNESLKQFLDGF